MVSAENCWHGTKLGLRLSACPIWSTVGKEGTPVSHLIHEWWVMGFVGLGLYCSWWMGMQETSSTREKQGRKWKSCKGKKHCSHNLRLWSYLSPEQAWIRHGLRLGSSQETCLLSQTVLVIEWSPDSSLLEGERKTFLVNERGFANSKHPHE